MEICARVAVCRNTRNAADGNAIYENNAFIALPYLRQVTLDDDRLAILVGEHFQQRAHVLVFRGNVKNISTTIAKERLYDDVFMLIPEGVNLSKIRRDQRRR